MRRLRQDATSTDQTQGPFLLMEGAGELKASGRRDIENRGDVKSGCKGVLLRNSGRNSGVQPLGTDSRRTGSVRTLELTQDAQDAQDAVTAHQMHVFFLLMQYTLRLLY